MYDNAVGGNDIITVTNSGKFSGCGAIGDAFDMHDNSKGGDDTITVIGGGGSDVMGDARTLYDNAQGGNDILDGSNGGGRFFTATPNSICHPRLVRSRAAKTC